jgi:hypothetical protein
MALEERCILQIKKTTLPSSVVVLKIWMFKNHRFSTISNQVNPILKLTLQTMAGILSNLFEVSFYAFTHNYSLFTLWFKPLFFVF